MPWFCTRGDLRMGPSCLGSPARTTWPDSGWTRPLVKGIKCQWWSIDDRHFYPKHLRTTYCYHILNSTHTEGAGRYLPAGLCTQSQQHVLPRPRTHGWSVREGFPLWRAFNEQMKQKQDSERTLGAFPRGWPLSGNINMIHKIYLVNCILPNEEKYSESVI